MSGSPHQPRNAPAAAGSSKPRVVAKFIESRPVPRAGRLRHWLSKREPRYFNALIRRFGGTRASHVFAGIDENWTRRRRRRARVRRLRRRLSDFRFYLYFDRPDDTPFREYRELAEMLRTWPSVEYAYVERVGPQPTFTPTDPEYVSGEQGYLEQALGIGASDVWHRAGGRGKDVRLGDIELGWSFQPETASSGAGSCEQWNDGTLVHEDLNTPARLFSGPNAGSNVESEVAHGNAVLGIVCMTPNTVGGVGIAPEIEEVFLYPWEGNWPTEALDDQADAQYSTNFPMVASVIRCAADSLTEGDVLLLEVQVDVGDATATELRPAELHVANRRAVEYAVEKGIIVVAAAGNGDSDLSTAFDEASNAPPDGLAPVLPYPLATDPGTGERLEDSGAILVAGSKPDGTFDRAYKSNHGSGVDCHARGEGVTTTREVEYLPGGDLKHHYTPPFGGTSAAAAIIAGAACCLQGIAIKNGSGPLSPTRMRELLSDPLLGTVGGLEIETTVMPNLAAIVAQEFPPNVYIRGEKSAHGTLPRTLAHSSPDLILRRGLPADAQELYGPDSGSEDRDDLSEPLAPGASHVVYVRVRNRGSEVATDVTANVYWTRVNTLLTPNHWNVIGSGAVPDVPPDDKLVVSEPIGWGEAPDLHHVALVGQVAASADAPTGRRALADFETFAHAIERDNNLAFLNQHVVRYDATTDPVANSGFAAYPFSITGAPVGAYEMFLEFNARLPDGSIIGIGGPPDFFSLTGMAATDVPRLGSVLHLPNVSTTRTPTFVVPEALDLPMVLYVSLPVPEQRAAHRLHVRQVWNGIEVGRVSWRIVPHWPRLPRRPFFKYRSFGYWRDQFREFFGG